MPALSENFQVTRKRMQQRIVDDLSVSGKRRVNKKSLSNRKAFFQNGMNDTIIGLVDILQSSCIK